MTEDPKLSITMAKRIELWPVERLTPYERNARTHSVEQVAQIAASIVEFGFTNPILVDSSDGIIAGHGRLAAAQELKLLQVPVVVLDHLSERQRRAYIIADNQLALTAGWDDELLKSELGELNELGFDLTLLGWGENLPDFAEMPDYSVLDEEDMDEQLNEMAAGVKKAIQIEFEPEHYEEAQELVKFWRSQDAYVGMMLIDKLKAEKAKL
jgi:ParB-like chromosome segregation protein Spo0J